MKMYKITGTLDYPAEVELSDEEVQSLLELIKEKGSTDPETLNLEEELPEVFEKLDDACRSAAHHAAYMNWAIDLFENNDFDDPEDLIERCEADGLFKFEPEDIDDFKDEDGNIDEYMLEDAKNEEFDDWLNNYFESLDDQGKLKFLEKYYTEELFNLNDGAMDYTYEVELPDEIMELASSASHITNDSKDDYQTEVMAIIDRVRPQMTTLGIYAFRGVGDIDELRSCFIQSYEAALEAKKVFDRHFPNKPLPVPNSLCGGNTDLSPMAAFYEHLKSEDFTPVPFDVIHYKEYTLDLNQFFIALQQVS
ncbi:MAG: hypothetical protein J6T04_03500 [Bacteroidales bacterium]|nr:hypothetical protein [Bacteroidales bacterium]